MAKVKAKKIEVTEALVKESLPEPPQNHSYSVERVTDMVIKVWLNHHQNYDYAVGKPVSTIYAYIKRDMVHEPKNSLKMKVKALCPLSELSTKSPYTTMVPDTNFVIDLLS